MIQNAQGVAGIDYNARTQLNVDGSYDFYFGPAAPKGKETNWVQTNAGDGFFIYFRWFDPEQAFYAKSWKIDDSVKIK